MPDDREQDDVFRALANATRRRILDVLREHPGANVNEVCAFFDTSRIAVMKHLRVLEEAVEWCRGAKGAPGGSTSTRCRFR